MFLLMETEAHSYLINLNEAPMLRRNDDRLSIQNVVLLANQEPAELRARFDDIVAALESTNVAVYKLAEDIGYWKPKPKSRTHKSAPADEAPPKK